MTIDGYNYAGDWELATSDASPLYDDPASPINGTGLTIDATVQVYLATGIPAAKYTMGFAAYRADWLGNLTKLGNLTNLYCGEYQNATQVSSGPDANGVGLCSSGNNQGSPALDCDLTFTNGLETCGTAKILLNNGYTAC